jgi:DMSO/TMAO reductase YedYZ molybdopterin-dependent catalytic subunit
MFEQRPRTPPGQTLTEKWPVLHYAAVPHADPATFRLRTRGLCEQPLELTWEQLRALPAVQRTSDFHCVTSWSRLDNTWEGVRFATLCDLTRPRAAATHCLLHCLDGYSTNVPLRTLREDDVLLAWSWQGQPLTPEHGGPLRMVVPMLYAWKSAKWLCAVEFLEHDRRGFWEERGYHNRADPWREERYSYQETGDET